VGQIVASTEGSFGERSSTRDVRGCRPDIILGTVPTSGSLLWSSGHSSWLQTQKSRVRFPALPDFLSSSESGTGPTQTLARINEVLLERKEAAPV
jgi:hypothetical protein